MKTLYVSDLDGTLLRSNETTSEYTNSVINNLTDRGMIFSYATARSLITAKKVTSGLRAEIPLIVYNGAFIVDNLTGEVLAANYFDESVGSVLDDLFGNQIFPIVYARDRWQGEVFICPGAVHRWYEEVPAQQAGGYQDTCRKVCGELESGRYFLHNLH